MGQKIREMKSRNEAFRVIPKHYSTFAAGGRVATRTIALPCWAVCKSVKKPCFAGMKLFLTCWKVCFVGKAI